MAEEGRITSGALRPLVLVPGACLGGWAWRDVAARLRLRGHEVFPVTLTGLGDRAHLGHAGVDVETHIADVIGVLEYEGLDDAVLVGHSYAGVVVTGVADRAPERLSAVVYLDTGPVPDGVALVDFQQPDQREAERLAVERDGDGWRWAVPDRATLSTGAYGSVSGLDDSHFALIAERATPQPYATFTSPLRLSGRPPHERRVAIFGADGGLNLELLRRLAEEGDPRAGVFAEPGWELHELPTGHWSMFSAPGPLAELLHQIASV